MLPNICFHGSVLRLPTQFFDISTREQFQFCNSSLFIEGLAVDDLWHFSSLYINFFFSINMITFQTSGYKLRLLLSNESQYCTTLSHQYGSKKQNWINNTHQENNENWKICLLCYPELKGHCKLNEVSQGDPERHPYSLLRMWQQSACFA